MHTQRDDDEQHEHIEARVAAERAKTIREWTVATIAAVSIFGTLFYRWFGVESGMADNRANIENLRVQHTRDVATLNAEHQADARQHAHEGKGSEVRIQTIQERCSVLAATCINRIDNIEHQVDSLEQRLNVIQATAERKTK